MLNNGWQLALKLRHPRLHNAGYYICEADNSVGNANLALLLALQVPKDCSGLFQGARASDGVYTIKPEDGSSPFEVYCDMTTNRGGWTLLQRRVDGSENFYRPWVDFKNGFGNIRKEFWLGNDKIHLMTKGRNMMVRFDLEDFQGNKVYAEYKTFYIDGEEDKYKLHVASYHGTAGNDFVQENGMQFSTFDRDNDIFSGNCAASYKGAWWYTNCVYSNINGEYLCQARSNRASWHNVVWNSYRGSSTSLKVTEMKIRPLPASN